MNNSRLEKFAPLTGTGAVLLMIVATVIFGAFDFLPSPERAVEIFGDNPMRSMTGGFLGLYSGILLIWFAGSVYSFFSRQESGDGRLSMIGFGGGVASGIAISAGFTAMQSAGMRASAVGGISPEAAVLLYDLFGFILGQMAAFMLAVFIGAAAIMAQLSNSLPKWMGWPSGVVAIGLISPIGYIVLVFAVVWLVAVSFWLYKQAN
ncbi:MAG: hypothetical protein FVQ83_07825 [Chloroflexi bacterium]|nr:hypothetical protein [Chloroflexota bacterium]